VVDVLRAAGRYEVVSDACIGSDGDTLTVRVFTSVPPEQVDTLWADPDSHTSAALARVIWREVFGRDLVLRPLPPGPLDAKRAPAVLLIGDKVVRVPRGTYTHEVDLGGVWRRHTGLPFVFAVWVRLAAGHAARGRIGGRLGQAALAGA
jgi:chorismate dehydratase